MWFYININFCLQDSDSEKETEPEYESNLKHNEGDNLNRRHNQSRSPELVRPRRSRFRDADSPDSHSRAAKEESPVSAASTYAPNRTREEIMQNIVIITCYFFLFDKTTFMKNKNAF